MPQPNHLPGPNADIWDWQDARTLPRGRLVDVLPSGRRTRPSTRPARDARQRDVPKLPSARPVPVARAQRLPSPTESGAECRRPNEKCTHGTTVAASPSDGAHAKRTSNERGPRPIARAGSSFVLGQFRSVVVTRARPPTLLLRQAFRRWRSSVVRIMRATDAALTTAERVTFTGSTTPSASRSP